MQIEINGTVTWGDTPDRMRKSLRESGIGVQEMADYLQVARNTVSTWINGRIEPSAMTLRLWALKTGVPFAWLCHGDMRPCDLRPRVGASQSRADRRTSNIMQSLAGRAVA